MTLAVVNDDTSTDTDTVTGATSRMRNWAVVSTNTGKFTVVILLPSKYTNKFPVILVHPSAAQASTAA